MNALVLDNLRLLTRLAGEAVVITLDLTDQPAYTFADPVQIEQVLYNLCANARDTMPSGGRLTLGTEPAMPTGTVFIHKPLPPDRLLRVVRAAIDMAGESGSETPSH